MILVFILLVLASYACIDHWVGGARLFRGEKSAQAANDGKTVWYWDARWVPYIVFALYTLALLLSVIGLSLESFELWAIICMAYFCFRSFSPVDIFPAANGATRKERIDGIIAGGEIGIIGLAPAILACSFNPYFAFLPGFGAFVGLYHWLFRKSTLFRSYAELFQGGLVVGPIVLLILLGSN